MNASELIFTHLSELVDGRVYPCIVPETGDDTPPYIVYQIVSALPVNTLDGVTFHERVRVQLDAYFSKFTNEHWLKFCAFLP